MAHALLGYDGDCRNIHGHSYQLHITLVGQPLKQTGAAKNGMVIDFKHLKGIVKDKLLARYDHALTLHNKTPESLVQALRQSYEKVLLTSFQPTCENLLIEMVAIIQPHLPPETKLHSVKLCETATSYAEWYAEDNV